MEIYVLYYGDPLRSPYTHPPAGRVSFGGTTFMLWVSRTIMGPGVAADSRWNETPTGGVPVGMEQAGRPAPSSPQSLFRQGKGACSRRRIGLVESSMC